MKKPKEGYAQRISVIVLVESTGLQQTQRFLRDLTGGKQHIGQMILVACGVTPMTLAWLRAETLRQVNWLLLEEHDEPIKAWTGAVRHAGGDLLCFVRDGLLVPEYLLEGLIEAMTKSPRAGLVAPVILPGAAGEVRSAVPAGFRERNRFRRIRAQSLAPACFMIRRDVWKAAGGFGADEDGPTDLAVRVAMLGLNVIVAGDIATAWGTRPADVRERSLPLIRRRLQRMRSLYAPGSIERLKLHVLDLLAQAEVLEHSGNSAGGVRILSDAITQYPESPALHAVRAWMLIRDGKHEDASRLLPETPDVVKRDPEWLDITGYCMQGLGEGVLARQCVEKAIDMDARNARAWLLKGMLAVDGGNAEDAENAFREAINIDPSFGEPYVHLGAVLWSREERKEAQAFIERGFILAPTHHEILATFADLARRDGYTVRAEHLVAEARMLVPVHRELAYLHAGLLRSLGREPEALDVLAETLVQTGLEDSALDEAFAIRSRVGPRETDSGPGSVSLCMIVRNEEEHLARCLASVASLVDEMVVVDTGSSDRTPLIAAVFGARVYTHRWTEDFAAARNAGLAHARGEWILVLDADEVLSQRDVPALRQLMTGSKVGFILAPRNYVRETDLQGWRPNDGMYDEEAGTGWIASPQVRLFPRGPLCVYENPVHETVEPSLARLGVPVRLTRIPVHHYGRLDRHRTRQKGELYAVIGRRKLADREGKEQRALFELAAQEQELGRHTEAAALWQEYVHLTPGDAHGQLALGVSLAALGRLREARSALRFAMQADNSPEEASIKCALVEMQLGDAGAALAILASPAQTVSEHPYTLATRAAALMCVGMAKEAGQILMQLGARRICSAGFFSTLAHDLEASGQQEYAAAVRAERRSQAQTIE
jgi:tetratricopeptide (TPR) repeat protein